MRIEWTALSLALLLLLPPLPLSASTKKFLKSRRNATTSIRSVLCVWQNWVDLIRVICGVYLLTEMAIRVIPEIKGAGTRVLLVEAAILGVVLLFQMVRISQGVQFVAPVFYICGIVLVLAGFTIGGFAVFAGWLFVIGCGSTVYQLPVMGLALVAAGVLLDLNLRMALACGLVFLPLIMSFMFRQELAFVALEPRVPTEGSPAD